MKAVEFVIWFIGFTILGFVVMMLVAPMFNPQGSSCLASGEPSVYYSGDGNVIQPENIK